MTGPRTILSARASGFKPMANEILVVDDEPDIRNLIAGILSDEGFECREAANSEQTLACLDERIPGLIILDIWLSESAMDGMEILDFVRRRYPSVPVIMISGHADIETAVNAIKIGAYDFIEKPFKADRLLLMAERALDAARLRRENAELRQRVGDGTTLIGQSPAITQLRNIVKRAAPNESRVLVTGPAGSGKEVVARMIHESSNRATGPFVVVNCATMTPDHMAIELFGNEPGPRDDGPRLIGTFERANGGTLLLDEVADMPLQTQGKIVRVLQEQTFHRVDGSTPVKVDVRVISTTSRDLAVEIAKGAFREDLYYRLNVVPIAVPPLRARSEDIPLFAEHFMGQAEHTTGMGRRVIGADAMAALQAYDWPGNVRQLRNVIDWILIMAGDDDPDTEIGADMLPPEIGGDTPAAMRWDEGSEVLSKPLRGAREIFERQYLKAQVNRFGGNVSRTAAFVGMERSALHRKLKSLGISPTEKLEETDA